MGSKNKSYAIGVLLTFVGGAGLAEISTSNHGCFWLCAILFSVGVGLCIGSYGR
jgi:uncharacterized membrane protein SpoIIM required for sporulation